MLVDLIVSGRETLIVGGGKEPEFKALKLLDSNARITVIGESFTSGLRRLASKNKGALKLVHARMNTVNVRKAVEELSPRVVFISTGDSDLDEELAGTVRLSGRRDAVVCVVDDPSLNDFNMPAIAELGDIRVGISTGGLSPAMASVLRQRIERLIRPEDILQVKLQGHVRAMAKGALDDVGARKEFAYRVIGDKRIRSLLKKGQYQQARKMAESILASASKERRKSVKKGSKR